MAQDLVTVRKAIEAFDDLPVADGVIEDIRGFRLTMESRKQFDRAVLVLHIFSRIVQLAACNG